MPIAYIKSITYCKMSVNNEKSVDVAVKMPSYYFVAYLIVKKVKIV